MQNSDKNKEILEKIKKIKKSYSTLHYLIENEDVESSIVIGTRTMRRLENLTQEYSKLSPYNEALMNVVFIRKIPFFKEDKKKLEEMDSLLEQNSLSGGEVALLRTIIDRNANYIRIIEKEIKNTLIIESFLQRVNRYINRWKKELILIGGPILIISIIVFLWRSLYTKKHSFSAEYYYEKEFKELYKKKNDPGINFQWGSRSPFLGFNVDHFSVRWKGYVQISQEGEYEFQTEADDGVRLLVNGVKVIENWSAHPTQVDRGRIFLKQGFSDIVLEYFEYDANAEIKLEWRVPGESTFSEIPSKLIFSSNKYFSN